MKKLQQNIKDYLVNFLKNYLSKLTFIIAILAIMAGLLPTYYMEYGSSASRLKFAGIYGILFILLILLGSRWLYMMGHRKIDGKKINVKIVVITLVNTLLSWAGIGLIEWGIQRIYQSNLWEELSKTSYLYLHRASLINNVLYPILAACFLFPLLLAGSSLREYWKHFILLILRAYPLLLAVGAGISVVQIYFKIAESNQSVNMAIIGTFLLWSVTVAEYVTIYQRNK